MQPDDGCEVLKRRKPYEVKDIPLQEGVGQFLFVV